MRGRWAYAAAGLLLASCGELDTSPDAAHLCTPSATGLAITELMPDPAGPDQGREWFELVNFGTEPIALDRMVLSIGAPDAPRQQVLTQLGLLSPGHILVLGSGTPDTAPIDASYGNLEMPNDTGILALHCRGVRMAGVVYGAADSHAAQQACVALDSRMHDGASDAAARPGCDEAPAPRAGTSLSLDKDGGRPPVWHRSAGPSYDGYNVGTPKAANLGAAVCRTPDGIWRRTKPPAAGDVQVVAVYADPPGRDDGREWLVLRVTSPTPVDLAGLRLWAQVPGHRPRQWDLESDACLSAGAGRELVVCLMTLNTPAHVRAICTACDVIVWGNTLPNQAMQLRLGFFQHNAPVAAPYWCDSLEVPRARCGVPYVRASLADAEHFTALWPPLVGAAL